MVCGGGFFFCFLFEMPFLNWDLDSFLELGFVG
jgi:hypothetical protein